MKKLFDVYYIDGRAQRSYIRQVKAKDIKQAEDKHYKEMPYTLVTKILITEK